MWIKKREGNNEFEFKKEGNNEFQLEKEGNSDISDGEGGKCSEVRKKKREILIGMNKRKGIDKFKKEMHIVQYMYIQGYYSSHLMFQDNLRRSGNH
jgi:hypothetical protein